MRCVTIAPTATCRFPPLRLLSIATMVTHWLLLFAITAAPADTAEPASDSAPRPHAEIDFGRDIRPILSRRCTQCHGSADQEAGLDFSTRESALAELDSGEFAVVPGDRSGSGLWERIHLDDDDEMRMPPEGDPLSAEEKEKLGQWIDAGAPWQDHWAFQQPTAPEPPPLPIATGGSSPIDRFIRARLLSADLPIAKQAPRRQLIRRLHYDLTGLPPTTEEVEAFVNDTAPDAYEQLVDRLLASPQFGERWARHWMDVIRYAETNSYERDAAKPFVWRYRDYIVQAFNEDKPYDQFIREQIAGDELEQVTPESMVATGFFRLGLFDDETADPYKHYFDQLDDMLATTTQAFLGLTINCCRCHDHKIDPMPQEDYYRMLAFYRNIKRYSKDRTNILQSVRLPEHASDALEKIDAEKQEIAAKLAEIEKVALPKLEGVDRDDFKYEEYRQQVLRRNIPKVISVDEYKRYRDLNNRRRELLLSDVPGNQLALAVVENGRLAPKTHLLGRGNPRSEVREVEPGYPAIFAAANPTFSEPPPEARSTHRRKVLADWIASEDNMLTGRVLVNRLWQHLFGRGIVRSPNNFGLGGSPPTHPRLLDYLADALVQGDWQMKPLIRQILLSDTYRSSARPSEEAIARDPLNHLFSHQNMRRLSAEEVRDSILLVTGQLNLEQQGPSIYPELSKEVLHSQSMPGKGWGHSAPDQAARRSIYIHIKRTLVAPILKIFDFAETDLSCPVRFETTQPTQALPMLNGKFAQDQAAALARRVKQSHPDDQSAQVKQILELVWQRPIEKHEIEAGLELIEQLQQQDGASLERSLETFSLVAINSNEFLYLD